MFVTPKTQTTDNRLPSCPLFLPLPLLFVSLHSNVSTSLPTAGVYLCNYHYNNYYYYYYYYYRYQLTFELQELICIFVTGVRYVGTTQFPLEFKTNGSTFSLGSKLISLFLRTLSFLFF